MGGGYPVYVNKRVRRIRHGVCRICAQRTVFGMVPSIIDPSAGTAYSTPLFGWRECVDISGVDLSLKDLILGIYKPILGKECIDQGGKEYEAEGFIHSLVCIAVL
jgi:hypothetical protein